MGNKMNTSIKTWVHLKTQKPYYKKSTKKRVEEIEKGIEENKEKFAKRIKQLDHILWLVFQHLSSNQYPDLKKYSNKLF